MGQMEDGMSDDLQDKPADGVPRGDRPSGELIVDPRLSRAIFDIVEALVVVMDREGRIRLFNRACERTTGYTSGEMEGRAIWDLLLTPEEAPTVRAVFAVLRAGDFPVEHENDWVAKDGRRRRIAWTNTALLDARGEVQWVIGTGIDVTEQRAAEAALRVSERPHRTPAASRPIRPSAAPRQSRGASCAIPSPAILSGPSPQHPHEPALRSPAKPVVVLTFTKARLTKRSSAVVF